MKLQLFSDAQYRYRRAKKCYVRYNARYGQIHVSAGVLDLFSIPYETTVYAQFAQDKDTDEWYLNLTQVKQTESFKLRKNSGKNYSPTQCNSLMCECRPFTRELAASLGAEAMKCPVSSTPAFVNGEKWYRIITTINLLSND